jgi:hypothetical protein
MALVTMNDKELNRLATVLRSTKADQQTNQAKAQTWESERLHSASSLPGSSHKSKSAVIRFRSCGRTTHG